MDVGYQKGEGASLLIASNEEFVWAIIVFMFMAGNDPSKLRSGCSAATDYAASGWTASEPAP